MQRDVVCDVRRKKSASSEMGIANVRTAPQSPNCSDKFIRAGEQGKVSFRQRHPMVSSRKYSGTFTVGPGRDVHGELKLARSKTSLYLHDKGHFDTYSIRNINGTLHDLTKVSLINCLAPHLPGSGGSEGERYHFARSFLIS